MAEPERGFLGLTHDPFTRSDDLFFGGADRSALLEQLRHLSKWARRLLVVTGPYAVGKTTMFRRLSANLEPFVKAARINSTLVSAPRDVLEGINQGFGVANPASERLDALKALVIDHVREQTDNDRPCVVLVDDAHLLDPAAVDVLLEVVATADLHIVFFGEPSFVRALEAAENRSDGELEWLEIELKPLGPREQRDYLQWRLKEAEYRGHLPFTDSQLERIARNSGGLPGKINDIAHELLVELELGTRGRSRGFPRAHLASAVALGLVIVIAYLLWGDRETPDTTAGTDVAALSDPAEPPMLERVESGANEAGGAGSAVGSVAAPTGAADTSVDELTIVGAIEPDSGADTQGTPAGLDAPGRAERRPVVDEPGAVRAEATPDPADPARIVAANPTAPVPAEDVPARVVETAAVPTAPDETPPDTTAASTTDTAATDTAATDIAATRAVEEAADVAPEPLPGAVRARDTVTEPAAVPPSGLPAPTAAPARDAFAVEPVQAGPRDAEFLLAQPPDGYTVQLLATASAPSLNAFLERQRRLDQFAVYRHTRGGSVLSVVVYGVFESRTEANRAAADLPTEVGRLDPWVRQLAGVQAAIRGTRQTR